MSLNLENKNINQNAEYLDESLICPVPAVYRSIDQVCKVLGKQSSAPQVKGLIKLCVETGLFPDQNQDHFPSNPKPAYLKLDDKKDNSFPFVVIEGLDGTGKTTLTKYLSSNLSMKLISTPPKHPLMQSVRNYFDEQPESIRRAYYSLGNYLAAQEVVNSQKPVVMDRFWHSTAAYAFAHLIKMGKPEPQMEEYIWPDDLLKPDLVIFLKVSEKERIRRHTLRKDFTNTKEEQTLAEDAAFRENLVECYRRVSGPKFYELNVDGEQSLSEAKILDAVLENIPSLSQFKSEKLEAR